MSFNLFSPPMSALSEVTGLSGGGKTELVLEFLARNPRLRVAWIEERLSIYPCAFPAHGVDLRRVFFVETWGQEQAGKLAGGSSGDSSKLSLWAAHQALQSQLFGVLILSIRIQEKDSLIALRRLQLAAEKNRAAVILIGEEPMRGASWPFHLRVQVSREVQGGVPRVSILKSRSALAWQFRSA